jgi:hypothetical protein
MLSIGPKVCICSFKCCAKFGRKTIISESAHVFIVYFGDFCFLVCPMYALTQSGHVNLHTPVAENLL